MHTNKITTDNLEKIRKKVAASATKNINEWNEQARIINKRNAYKADEFKTDLHHEDSNLKSDTYNFVNKKIVDAEDALEAEIHAAEFKEKHKNSEKVSDYEKIVTGSQLA